MFEQQDVLLVDQDMKEAGLIVRALIEAAPDLLLHITSTVSEAYDFLFSTGSYAGDHQEHCPQLILFSLKLLDSQGGELLQLLKLYAGMRTIPIVLFASPENCLAILRDRKALVTFTASHEDRSEARSGISGISMQPRPITG